MLYTKDNPTYEQFLSHKDSNSIRFSNFNKLLPLKIIVHGFTNNRSTNWLHLMKNAILEVTLIAFTFQTLNLSIKKLFLKTQNANVLIVAWGEGCIYPLYNNASANIRVVGKELSILVKSIRNIFYPNNPNQFKVHCIGHSLGMNFNIYHLT